MNRHKVYALGSASADDLQSEQSDVNNVPLQRLYTHSLREKAFLVAIVLDYESYSGRILL